MPVNYERAPWDPKNSLYVRLVNQRLADNQRKATFIDTFLHAPRVCLYINEPAGHLVLFCVLHPAYPVVTAYVQDTGKFTVPPGELTPNYTSAIHALFTWDRVPYYEVYWRSDDAVGLVCFNRYFRGQYQDSQGRNTLYAQVGLTDGWQSTGIYSQYLEALNLAQDYIIGTRPESTWSLDTLWQNKKFIFGRQYERMPETAEFYMPQDSEVPQYEEEEEIEDKSLSEASWPRLIGYSTQYIDNLGIFVPTNYTINPVLTQAVRNEVPESLLDIFDKMVILDKGSTASTVAQFGYQRDLRAFSGVPVIGGMIGGLINWAWRDTAQKPMFWNRAYAFGRQPTPVASKSECLAVSDWYYNKFQKTLIGPPINRVNEAMFTDLISNLLKKRYIDPSMVKDW